MLTEKEIQKIKLETKIYYAMLLDVSPILSLEEQNIKEKINSDSNHTSIRISKEKAKKQISTKNIQQELEHLIENNLEKIKSFEPNITIEKLFNETLTIEKKNKSELLDNDITKSGIHYEQQKVKSVQLTLDDILKNETNNSRKRELEKQIIEHRIEAVGIDITDNENKCMHAIQTLLTKTNYKGNEKNDEKNGLPILSFTPSEFLQCFGCTKIKDGDKLLFGMEGRRRAYDSLISLATKKFFIYYTKTYWEKDEKGKNKRYHDVVREISPLITVLEGWQKLTDLEMNDVTNNNETYKTDDRLTKIMIRPHRLLVDQIDSYFVIKPANYLQEIKWKIGTKASKFTYRFIDLLYLTVTKNLMNQKNDFNWIFERNIEVLAVNLRMDTYVKNRKWKLIRQILNKCYHIAQELGYINNFEVDVMAKTKVVDKLYLNKDKFYRVQETEKHIKKLEKEAEKKYQKLKKCSR